jgi:hypothetical protein
METVVTVLGSITAAFVAAYVTTMWRLRREHELDIDTDLRTARIEAFKRPWETLKVLSLHNVEAPTRPELAIWSRSSQTGTTTKEASISPDARSRLSWPARSPSGRSREGCPVW